MLKVSCMMENGVEVVWTDITKAHYSFAGTLELHSPNWPTSVETVTKMVDFIVEEQDADTPH